jgi:glycosyltransferase involved in cell wall biosynthesis
MKIGIAAPMSLGLLNSNFRNQTEHLAGYDFPMTSMLVNALTERGNKVVAYTTSVGIRESLVYEDERLTLCIAPREPHAARDLFRSERKKLLELMHRYPVDIINAHWSYEFAWSALDTRLPVLVNLNDHALTVLRHQFDPYRVMRLIMNWVVLNKAMYLSVPSPYLFGRLSKRDKKKAKIIPNFYAKSLEEQASEQEPKSNFIISVSNGFGKIKNISNALRAFVLIRQSFPNVEYHLIGDGMEMGGPAYDFAVAHRITEGVHFGGNVSYDSVLAKLKDAILLLHPSREESFGMSVLEAMVMGTPVVSGNHSGNVPYLLDNGNAGQLCDIEIPESIAAAVARVLSDSNYAKSLSTNAQTFARQNYSEQVIVGKYLDYYQEIVKS